MFAQGNSVACYPQGPSIQHLLTERVTDSLFTLFLGAATASFRIRKAAPALTTAPLHPSLTTPESFWSTLSAKLPGVTKTNQAMLREESCVRGQKLSAQGTEGSLPRNKIRGYQVQRKLLFIKNKVAIWDDLKQNSVG